MPEVVLETQNLTKHYGDLTAVDDLSLKIFEGEVLGFLGPNGAGKTTAIHMMCGLLKPDAGHVFIQGEPLSEASDTLRTRVGVCPQEIVIWERLTCIEQLQFIGQMYGLPGRLARQRGDSLLNALDLLDKRSKLARTLSGGMKRRLNLAMALVHDPDIVVLDEPEAGLDPQSRVKVRQYIQSLAQTKTVILTTHNMDEADRVADRVAIIDHGKLLVVDTPDELKFRVGEGDVIEVTVEDLDSHNPEWVSGLLPDPITPEMMEIDDGQLRIRTHNAVGILPTILEALEAIGLIPSDVRIRANTLEDVFIKLTGKKLRE